MLAELVLDAALRFLNTEVPRWQRDNHCFSCHNNGDGARALCAAQALGIRVPAGVLEETTSWLRKPPDWARIRGAPVVGPANLARVQFAAALAEAYRAGAVRTARCCARRQRSSPRRRRRTAVFRWNRAACRARRQATGPRSLP